jgi:hypothetical protein
MDLGKCGVLEIHIFGTFWNIGMWGVYPVAIGNHPDITLRFKNKPQKFKFWDFPVSMDNNPDLCTQILDPDFM